MKKISKIAVSAAVALGCSTNLVFATNNDLAEINKLIINDNQAEQMPAQNQEQPKEEELITKKPEQTEKTVNTGSIYLTILNSNSSPVEGAEFNLKDQKGNILQFTISDEKYNYMENGYYNKLTTNIDGGIHINNLPLGNYTLNYKSNIDGMRAKDPISINITPGLNHATYKFAVDGANNNTDDSPQNNYGAPISDIDVSGDGAFELNVTTDENVGVAGIEFELLDANGKKVECKGSTGVYRVNENSGDRLFTNANGNLFLRGLKDGTYKLRQVGLANGFNNENASANFTISGSDTKKKSVKFKSPRGSLMIELRDADTKKEISEGKYVLKDASGKAISVTGEKGVYTKTNNESNTELIPYNGYINISGLLAGDYKLESIISPSGYAKTSIGLNVRADHEDKKEIALGIATGSLEINITDETSEKAVEKHGIKLLDKDNKEVFVELKNDGMYAFSKTKTKDKIKTDKNGQILISGLPVGIYKIQETDPAKGYLKNKKEENISVEEDKKSTLDIKAQRSNAAIGIIDEQGLPVAGAKISIIDKDNQRVFSGESNKNGKVLISGVKAGKYKYRIRSLHSPYINKVYEGSFSIDKNGDVADLSDIIVESNKVIVKTNNIEGVYFKIYNKTESFVQETATDINGEIVFSGMEDGKYTVIQTDGPDNVDVSKEKTSVSINRDTKEPIELKFDLTVNKTENEESNKDQEKNNKPFVIGLVIATLGACAAYIWKQIKDKKEENKEIIEDIDEINYDENDLDIENNETNEEVDSNELFDPYKDDPHDSQQ